MRQDNDAHDPLEGIAGRPGPSRTEVLIVAWFVLLCGCCAPYFAAGKQLRTVVYYMDFWHLAVNDCGVAEGTGLLREHFETWGWDWQPSWTDFDVTFRCEAWKGEKARRTLPAATPISTP
jgi:hypothetical protein